MSLQLENLCDSDRIYCEEDIRAELGRLPATLKEIYDVIHAKIKNAAITTRIVAERTIKWLLGGYRNLKTAEFVAAVSIGLNIPTSVAHIQQACRNLVVEDTELKIIRFTHLSVREYFEEQAEYNSQETNMVATVACLETLGGPETSQGKIFYSYAAIYWVLHYQNISTSTRYTLFGSVIRHFLGNGPSATVRFSEWVESIKNREPLEFPESPAESRQNRLLAKLSSKGNYEITGDNSCRHSLAAKLCEIPKTPLTPLFLLSVFGFTDLLQSFITDNAMDLDAKNDRGNSLLHLCVHGGHQDTVEALLRGGAKAHQLDKSGWSPLSWAVEYKQEDITSNLLNFGATANCKDSQNLTPLLRATRNQDFKFVKLLLEHDADPDFSKDRAGFTPLRWATSTGRVDIMELLLEKNANREPRDRTGWTPLLTACRDSLEKPARLLLERGANPNLSDWDDWTPLARAVDSGNETIAKLLLFNGATVDSQDAYGRTPLRWAVTTANLSMTKLLIQSGADPDHRDRDGWSVQQLATMGQIETIIQAVADVI